ncbi:hypothetical protein Sps_05245 [Shewanella psychrophila]|uniref:DUF2846 domain-containing protein n=1 Tax=Shewanella psychrophila TaxID=225848 RepID=A0A1S6HY04_9GAMM|nr:hypothetical protein [Shewanella psychrophila]AQS40314.1 hypothetical protein Sps_05245 [Shewanella psychrophila]
MKYLKLITLIAIMSLSGCAGKPFITPSTQQVIELPQADKAQIIFLNPANSISGAFLVGLYDVKGEDKTFYGMLGSKTMMVQNVEPGHHLFMSHTTLPSVATFLNADVEAGKRYYVLLRYIYGNGFQLRPIKTELEGKFNPEFSPQNPEFDSWLEKLKLVDQTEQVSVWYKDYKSNVDEAQAEAWTQWQNKDASQKSQLTLGKDDFLTPKTTRL